MSFSAPRIKNRIIFKVSKGSFIDGAQLYNSLINVVGIAYQIEIQAIEADMNEIEGCLSPQGTAFPDDGEDVFG